MALTKYKIGSLISVIDERNEQGIRNFFGININKEFMPTVANTESLDEKKYKVVRKNRFVYSGMQTGRDECIRISMYTGEEPIIVSPAYTTFEVTATEIVLPTYFFMLFLSKEKDRLGWFYSDSSIRANLDWDVFCDIELKLPSVEVQKKYVDIYNAMLLNQSSYINRLDDLKLVIDATIERFKHDTPRKYLGDIIEEIDIRNEDGKISNVHGVNKEKQFMQSVASGADLTKYKLVKKDFFACNLMHVGRDVAVPIALRKEDTPLIVSPAYLVFRINDENILPEFVLMWLSRSETDRYAWFMSDTNVRSGMEKKRFYEIDLPIPSLVEQKSLVELYEVMETRRIIGDRLKDQLKNICPILVKGSIEEAS